MASSQPDAVPGKTSAWTSLWLLACGFNAAVGTAFIGARYYVLPGFSWLDALLCLAALRAMLSARRTIVPPSRIAFWHTWATLGFSFWLILSILVNAFWFETFASDVLPALKLVYMAIVVVMIRRYTVLHGVRTLLIGCFLGVLTVTLQDLAASERMVGGLPLLLNPNVTGALLGLGVWFAVFGLLFTPLLVANLITAMIFSALSLTSFSKGAWLMCGFGLLAAFIAVAGRKRRRRSEKFRVVGGVVIAAALVQSAILVRANMDLITRLVALKVTSTVESGSADLRADFIRAALRAGIDYPVFGLGYRNFYQTERLYPDLQLPKPDRMDNAHNLFAQTLAVGGLPALVLLGVVFVLPFRVLWQKLKGRASLSVRAMIWILSFGVWLLYGAVQLELIANPPFWFFCGLIFGIPARPVAADRAATS